MYVLGRVKIHTSHPDHTRPCPDHTRPHPDHTHTHPDHPAPSPQLQELKMLVNPETRERMPKPSDTLNFSQKESAKQKSLTERHKSQQSQSTFCDVTDRCYQLCSFFSASNKDSLTCAIIGNIENNDPHRHRREKLK